jgi:archaemetzincin
MKIDILPVNNVDKTLLESLRTALEKRKIKTRLLKHDRLSKNDYNKYREQYDAVKILNRLNKKCTLVVTSEDIYEGGLNFIFGLADTGGSAIVSYYRLRPEFYGARSNRSLLLRRLLKEALHEIGHMFGLKHCRSTVRGKPCVMTFSNSVMEVDKKSSFFCKKCAAMLE